MAGGWAVAGAEAGAAGSPDGIPFTGIGGTALEGAGAVVGMAGGVGVIAGAAVDEGTEVIGV